MPLLSFINYIYITKSSFSPFSGHSERLTTHDTDEQNDGAGYFECNSHIQ